VRIGLLHAVTDKADVGSERCKIGGGEEGIPKDRMIRESLPEKDSILAKYLVRCSRIVKQRK
jgi:hypothetical protein